ncbi:MAG: glycosyltransferase family 4 protein, partial [Ignavibacteria bacterium]|nr:glycosyltransferase family 4 protein [Ignavibacteria bacterium]
MRILLTSTHVTSFIKDDLAFLRSHFPVDHLITSGPGAPVAILTHMRGISHTFTWFASVYAGLVVLSARLLGKRTILVVGGADLARFPEIGYGLWNSRWKAGVAKYALRHADRVLAVDGFLKEQARTLARYDGSNIEVIPTGFDAAFWTPSGPRELRVLTVAVCVNEARVKVKGIDILFEAARRLKDTPFSIVGMSPDMIARYRNEAPENVEMIPPVEQSTLREYYRRSSVYCQPSMMEGLPNSVCEAMLCGCIPVGTRVGGMQTAIEEQGVLVPYGDPEKLADVLSEVLHRPAAGLSERARNH